jgi:hypothetical protein
MNDKLVNRVATAITQHPVQKSWNFETARFDYDYTSAATAAIAAVHEALQEPNENQQQEGFRQILSRVVYEDYLFVDPEAPLAVWQAMLEASPIGEKHPVDSGENKS